MTDSLRVAVTGATGFIGRTLLPLLEAGGHRVRRLMRARVFEEGGPLTGLPGFDLAGDGRLDAALLSGCDALIHLAAYIPRNTADPGEAEGCFAANAVGSLRLLEAAARAGIRRVVHAGAGTAYAFAPTPRRESDALFPAERAPYYLLSKVAEEVFAAHWSASAGIPVCCLRIGAVYGSGQRGLFNRWMADAAGGRPLRVDNGGVYGADFVLVDDVAAAIVAALNSTVEGPVNIGSGERRTLLEAATLIVDAVGSHKDLIVTSPMSDPGARGYPALDVDRARELLAFEPTSIADGLARMARSLD